MDKIRGDVNVLGIANILQMLGANKLEGLLTIAQGNERKTIQFTPEGIRLVEIGKRKLHTLGEILIRSNRITRAQLDKLLEEQRKSGRKLGEMVAGMGLLSKEEITQALREQAEEEIFDLFLWEEARFQFTEGSDVSELEANPLADVMLDSNMTSLMLEAARRADELKLIREVIRDEDVTPYQVAASPPEGNPNLDSECAESIYPFLDGSMTVGEIIMASLYARFIVLRTLYVLANEGAIRIVDQRTKRTREKKAPLRMEKPSPTGPAGPRRTVLLASGLPLFRTTLGNSLRASNYDVVEEDLSAELINTVTRYRFDAAIVDIALTDVDALKLCMPLKNAIKAPIIVLSANTSKEAVVTAIKSGARDYVVKPFKHELLLDRLSQLFKR